MKNFFSLTRFIADSILPDIVSRMKTVRCSQCPHAESAATEKEALNKMQSHIRNAHGAQKSAELKKMMKAAQRNISEGVPRM